VAEFADSLEMLLDDIETSAADPESSLTLLILFFETDSRVFERCDDSNGYVGGVFARAVELFVGTAQQCKDNKKLAKLLLKLCKVDEYGIRGQLMDCAAECGLDEALLRSMVVELQQWADAESDDYQKQHHYSLIQTLAQQLNDAALFEKAYIGSWGKLSVAAYLDIARIYIAKAEFDAAISTLNNIADNESFMARERDQLWQQIYQQQGNTEQLLELLSQRFYKQRTVSSLTEVLDAVNNDDETRIELLFNAIKSIKADDYFNTQDVMFLLELEFIGEAEAYLFKHAKQIDGRYYEGLLPLVKGFEAHQCYLAVSLLYRPLLLSILERAYNKAYSHAARYLRKLDNLAHHIDDWQSFDSHDDFKAVLIEKHGRKSSFWSKYE
jgi:hypothetical protein